jgi:sec-independent protein translocase protein TatB
VIDFGIDKLALIGAVALIVIGPERLPKVARTVGALLGKAQRYVAQVQAEVNRSIELEELNKMKAGFQTAASEVGQSLHEGLNQAQDSLSSSLDDGLSPNGYTGDRGHDGADCYTPSYSHIYAPPRKNFRLKRGATPIWYKQRNGIKRHVQSGAARVARYRPAPSASSQR